MNPSVAQLDSPWPHRMAVVLVCATFPLIWIGGLVTTTDAGMAVPDWPNTFGYNLLLYPWQTWLAGPWDVFIEHGHRLFAVVVGMITIALALTLWRRDSRRWVQYLGLAALAAVILQGVLGGMRVLFSETRLAMIHGCFAPAFFGICVALAVVTSRRWRAGEASAHPQAGRLQRLSLLTAGLAYFQLVLGAQIRHMPATAGVNEFQVVLVFHLLMATALFAHVLTLAWRTWRGRGDLPTLWTPALVLTGFLVLQLVLGVATWVANYGWPAILPGPDVLTTYTVHAGGMMQAVVTTAHVALGSLIFVIALALALRCLRLLRGVPHNASEAAL